MSQLALAFELTLTHGATTLAATTLTPTLVSSLPSTSPSVTCHETSTIAWPPRFTTEWR